MSLSKQLARKFEFQIETEYSDWLLTTEYTVYDVVLHETDYYICIQSHTSDTTDEPNVGDDWELYWDKLDITDNYIKIRGVNSFSSSPSKNTADVTDFDSDGWDEHIVASRGSSFSIDGFYVQNDDNDLRSYGQAKVEKAASEFGDGSIVTIKVIGPTGKEIGLDVSIEAPYEGLSDGGGNDDPASWSITLTVIGQPYEITG